MRFFIFPALSNLYDQKMVAGLADGFRELGYAAYPFLDPLSEGTDTRKKIHSSGDVIIEVNKFRSNPGCISENVRHIAWFQDIFIETVKNYNNFEKSGDIVYTLGDGELLGMNVQPGCFVGSLLTGVDSRIFDIPLQEGEYNSDVSLVGFIPPKPGSLFRPYNRSQEVAFKLHYSPYFGQLVNRSVAVKSIVNGYIQDFIPEYLKRQMISTMNMNYEPLSGFLDIHTAAHDLESVVNKFTAQVSGVFPAVIEESLIRNNSWTYILTVPPNLKSDFKLTNSCEVFISWLVREYPRYCDRIVLANLASALSKSFSIYGPGWDMHPEFSKFWSGVVNSQHDLLEIYSKSRINLANNTHGLGIHSRTLESMAVGGLIMMHDSPNETRDGGMGTCFEPGVHYINYTRNTFIEKASPWLKQNSERKKIIQNAREVVREQHLWRHRASQILNDLNL